MLSITLLYCCTSTLILCVCACVSICHVRRMSERERESLHSYSVFQLNFSVDFIQLHGFVEKYQETEVKIGEYFFKCHKWSEWKNRMKIFKNILSTLKNWKKIQGKKKTKRNQIFSGRSMEEQKHLSWLKPPRISQDGVASVWRSI